MHGCNGVYELDRMHHCRNRLYVWCDLYAGTSVHAGPGKEEDLVRGQEGVQRLRIALLRGQSAQFEARADRGSTDPRSFVRDASRAARPRPAGRLGGGQRAAAVTRRLCVAALILAWGAGSHGATIRVEPQPADSMRALHVALERSQPGDSLLLMPGVYRGTYWLKKGVSLLGIAGPDSTILDAAGERYCLMGRGIDSTTVITGLTLQNGRRPHANSGGGGIYLHRSSPVIVNNVFRHHLGYFGPGVYANYDSHPVVAFNVFHDNEGYLGGAIAAYIDCNPLIYNNLVFDNQAVSGGGVLSFNSAPVVVNNTLVRNQASQGGGGVYFNTSPALVEANVIANSGERSAFFCLDDAAPATLRHNLLWQNGAPGRGNLCAEVVGRDGNCRADPGIAAGRLDPRRASLHTAACAPGAGARAWEPTVNPQVPDSILSLWRSWRRAHGSP